MLNNENNIGARKLSFCIIYIEILIQFLMLFYLNNSTLTRYMLFILFFLSTILCFIEIKRVSAINLMITTMIVTLMIISTINGSGGWGAIINALILILNLLVLSQMKFSYNQMRSVSYTYVIFFIVLICFSDRINTYYVNTSIFDFTINPNVVAFLALLNSFFAINLIQNKYYVIKYIIVIFLSLFLLFDTGARTSLVAFLIFIFLHIVNKQKPILKIKYNKYKFWVCFFIIASFCVIYIYAFFLPTFLLDNKLIVLNKNIFTGRQIIWQEIINLMKQYWFFGVGADYAFKNNELYSAHNFFLGYAATFGIPVMIGIIILLYRILKECFIKNKNKNTNYLFCIWIVLLIVSTFETVLSYSPIIIFSSCVFVFNLDQRIIGGNLFDT